MKHKTSPTDNASAASAGVCVLTARGMAAIASIALTGAGAGGIVERLFEKAAPACGRSIYGTIKDDGRVIDSVVAACERPECYVIHCHGNPLLVEQIVRICRRHGAILQQPHEYLFARYRAESQTLIEAEARLSMTQAVTREGVALLQGQIAGGLSAWATRWINYKSFDINKLIVECADIIERSRIARRIISGVRIALVGPPNSGKSTLLNWLAGDNAALVSETAGTTRDWVSATCRIGPMRAEVIDTAGLDAGLAKGSELDRAAQAAAFQTAAESDLILNIQDCTCPTTESIPLPPGVSVLKVFTKIDLAREPAAFRTCSGVPVSAKTKTGLGSLCQTILSTLKVDTSFAGQPICFSERQLECLKMMQQGSTPQSAAEQMAELINKRQAGLLSLS